MACSSNHYSENPGSDVGPTCKYGLLAKDTVRPDSPKGEEVTNLRCRFNDHSPETVSPPTSQSFLQLLAYASLTNIQARKLRSGVRERTLQLEPCYLLQAKVRAAWDCRCNVLLNRTGTVK